MKVENHTQKKNTGGILALLARFGSMGIKLQLQGDNIKVIGKTKPLDPEILKEIKDNKNEILNFLLRHSAADLEENSIPRAGQKEYYPLSSAQKRLFILQDMMSGNITYNMPTALKLKGNLDGDRLLETFRRLIQRHESLRTSFHLKDDTPVQKIHNITELDFEVESVNLKSIHDNLGGFLRPFDLGIAPLLRVGLTVLEKEPGDEDDCHLLVVDMHHIISDGTSMNVLVTDFARIYEGEKLPGLKIQYKDFAQWQQEEPQQLSLKEKQAFWLEHLSGELPWVELPLDFPRPMTRSFKGKTLEFKVGPELTRALNVILREEGVTLYMFLLSIFTILLSKLGGGDDIIVGTPVAGRVHADLNQVIGMFINTLPLRNQPLPGKSFNLFLHQLKERTLDAFANQEYPFEELVEQLDVRRDTSANPLFDTLFALQNMDIPSISIPGLTIEKFQDNSTPEIAKFDLTFSSIENNGQLHVAMEYCTDLFKAESIERFFGFYHRILEQVTNHREITIGGIELIDEKEKNEILVGFNKMSTKAIEDATIPQLFLQQVRNNKDRIALTGPLAQLRPYEFHDYGTLSYGELDCRSTDFARLLQERGVVPGDIVALMLERSTHMIAVILSILKSGAAYLPIEIGCPLKRMEYMLKDSGAKILITTKSSQLDFDLPLQVLFIEELPEKEDNNSLIPSPASPGDIAYIIYTSGTTGKPKGVTTSHTNVLRVVKETNYLDIHDKDRVLQLSNYAFDGSVFDIYGALLNGATLVSVDGETLVALDQLAAFIVKQGITLFFLTTALFNTLVDMEIDCLKGVRKTLFGGERVSTRHVRKALDYLGKNRVIHVYGPTETTVYASYYPISHMGDSRATIPIGRPLTGTSIYILDRERTPVPIGVSGEIFIGGSGVARGYLNRPELTDDKFCHAMGKRLYRSGDLGRWLPGGNVEFLGRMDHQVKLRGFRIEVGEIESAILSHVQIKEAVVRALGGSGSDQFLCAYMVPFESIEPVPDQTSMRAYLAVSLPEYMIPSYFLFLDKLPLTANGKLDQKNLPLPETGETDVEYIPPRDELEGDLVEIWGEILSTGRQEEKRPRIGIDDNFFQLGGHSLKATILKARIKKRFEIEIPLTEMFATPTIRGMADIIRAVNWAKNSELGGEDIEMEEMIL